MSGFHRTYVGQVERGEKNISFANLSKIAGVLGVTMSELLSGLESGGQETAVQHPVGRRSSTPSNFRLQKLVRQLRLQQSAMEQVTTSLAELVLAGLETPPPRERKKRATSRK